MNVRIANKPMMQQISEARKEAERKPKGNSGSKRPWPGGFSLVEIMCAILILGVALVGLTQGITTALGSSKESEVQTAAALLAAGRIEQLRADGFIQDGMTDGDCGDNFPNYQWKQTIAATPIKGLHDVELLIENTQSGKEIFSLRTLLFEAYVTPETQQTNDTKRAKQKKKREE